MSYNKNFSGKTLPAELHDIEAIDWEYQHECRNCFVTVCEVCTGSRECLCKCNGVERNVAFLEECPKDSFKEVLLTRNLNC